MKMKGRTMPEELETSTRLVTLRDGATIRTATSGVGSPAVWCHGGPGLWDYLAPVASLVDDSLTSIRFDQRGCGRSTGSGPFTIAQAVDDLDQVRDAFDLTRWAVFGHSWGAELALRYAASHPERTTAVVYIAGVGAGDGFLSAYVTERNRRFGADFDRWTELGRRDRTDAEERERCLLQWRPDFHPPPRPNTPPRSGTPDHRASLSTRQPTMKSGPTARSNDQNLVCHERWRCGM